MLGGQSTDDMRRRGNRELLTRALGVGFQRLYIGVCRIIQLGLCDLASPILLLGLDQSRAQLNRCHVLIIPDSVRGSKHGAQD